MQPTIECVSAKGHIKAPIGVIPKVALEGGTNKPGRSTPPVTSAKVLKMLHRSLVVFEGGGGDGGMPEHGWAVHGSVKPSSTGGSSVASSDSSFLDHPERLTTLRIQLGAS